MQTHWSFLIPGSHGRGRFVGFGLHHLQVSANFHLLAPRASNGAGHKSVTNRTVLGLICQLLENLTCFDSTVQGFGRPPWRLGSSFIMLKVDACYCMMPSFP